MLAKSACLRFGPGMPRRQDGVVLMVALIVLVAMTLAGIALVRSVDTSNIIAGNLAFKQAATNSGDTGIETAVAWLAQNAGPPLSNDVPAQGYASSFNPAIGPTQSWDDYWNNVLAPNAITLPQDAAGNTVAYIIQRLCNQANMDPLSINVDCAASQWSVASDSSSKTAGTVALIPIQQTLYRVTVRVRGPRNTVSYVQAIVAL